MSAYEENLQARREKLRDLVSSEEASLTREITEVARRDEGARFEEKLARRAELRKRQEEEHAAAVAAKRTQQYLASCPDVKRELSRRSAIDAKRCNVAQMANGVARRSAERELDGVWHEVMLRDAEAKRHKETEESVRRALAERETVSTLARQVSDKLALEDGRKRAGREEREHLERLWEDARRAELGDLETERRRREKLRVELEEQILTAKKLIGERAREEATVDRALGMLAEEELARERARAKQDTAALRAELDSHLGYLENLRREEAERSREVEAVVRRSREEIEARRELASMRFKEARRRAAREVLRGREEQLMARREAEKREQRLRMEEREALERQIEMDADLAATEQKENRQKALRYGLELKEQQRCVETTRRRELEEERRYHRAEMKRQAEEYQRLADKLLNASESITPHPFKVLLKEPPS